MTMIPGMQRWRQFRGLSQDQLAEKLGVHKQTVSCWERGAKQPCAKTLVQIADLLKCKPGDLFACTDADAEGVA